VRIPALLLATVPLTGSFVGVFAALLVLAFAGGCDDDCGKSVTLLTLAAGLLFIVALAFWLLVAINDARGATVAYAIHAAGVIAAIGWGSSRFGDVRELAWWTLAVETCGLVALMLCRAEATRHARETDRRRRLDPLDDAGA
jgi:hypothetical protein